MFSAAHTVGNIIASRHCSHVVVTIVLWRGGGLCRHSVPEPRCTAASPRRASTFSDPTMVAGNRKRSARSLASSPAAKGKEKTTPELSARVKKAAARSGTATVQATRSLVEDWMDKNPKLIVALWAAVSTTRELKFKVDDSVHLDASWEMEEMHDDLSARVVNKLGVPVYLNQFFVTDRKNKKLPAANEGKKNCLQQALKICNEAEKRTHAADSPMLTKRKEQLNDEARIRRTAKSKPTLSLGVLCDATEAASSMA